MNLYSTGKLITGTIIMMTVFSLTACKTTGGAIGVEWGKHSKPHHGQEHADRMPPAHAPAHGRRAQHRYHYYPSSEIYFDIDRKVYFYLSGDGWKISATLPHRLRIGLGDHVSMELETDKPYQEHKKHKGKYPPGLARKNGKKNKGNRGRGNSKGKGWHDDD